MPIPTKTPTIDWTKPESWPENWWKSIPNKLTLPFGMSVTTPVGRYESQIVKPTGTFASQIEKWQYENIKWQESVRIHQEEMNRPENQPQPKLSLGAEFVQTFGAALTGKLGEQKKPAVPYEQLNQQVTVAGTNIQRSSFFTTFYQLIDSWVNTGEVKTVDDYISLMKYTNTQKYLTAADLSEANTAISILLHKAAPTTAEESLTEFLTAATSAIKVTPQLPHVITVEEIIKSLTTGAPTAAEDTTGISAEDKLSLMANMGIPPDVELTVEAWKAKIQPFIDAVSKQESDLQAVIDGSTQWEMPQLGLKDQLMYAISQPMTQLSDAMKPYLTHVSYPLAGLAALNVQRLIPGTQGVEQAYADAKSKGGNWWDSMGTAWAEWEAFQNPYANFFAKFAVELVTDPLTYIPGLGLSIPGKALKKVGFNSFGQATLKFNEALWKVGNAPFDWASGKIAQFGTTLRMASEQHVRSFGQVMFAHQTATSGVMEKIGSVKFVGNIKTAIDAFVKNPNKTGNLAVDMGRFFAEATPLEPDKIAALGKKFGKSINAEDLTDNVVESVNDTMQLMVKRLASVDDGAKAMIAHLGLMPDKKTLTAMKEWITDWVGDVTTKRISALETLAKKEAANGYSGTMKVFSAAVAQQTSIWRATEKSMYILTKQQSGITAALVNMVDVLEKAKWRVKLERMFNRPLVTAYLARADVTLGNIAEPFAVMGLEGLKPGLGKWDTFGQIIQGLRIDPLLMKSYLERKNLAGGVSGLLGRHDIGTVHILPGKFPYEIAGKDMPSWLAGSTFPEWFGRGLLDVQDYVGTMSRVSSVTQLYMRELAARLDQLQTGARDALKKVIDGRAPKMPKVTGITARDVESDTMIVVLNNADHPENIAQILKDKFNVSNMTKKAQMQILSNNSTDWSYSAKMLAISRVEEGGVLRDEVINYMVDWDRMNWKDLRMPEVGLPMDIDWKTRETITKMVNDLPVAIQTDIRNIVIDPELIEKGWLGVWRPSEKSLMLSPKFFSTVEAKKLLVEKGRRIEETLYHEILHSYIQDRWVKGDYSLISSFVEDAVQKSDMLLLNSLSVKGSTIMWDVEAPAMKEWLAGIKVFTEKNERAFYARFTYLNELLAKEFGRYYAGEKTLLASSPNFFERFLPKKPTNGHSIRSVIRDVTNQNIHDYRLANWSMADRFDFLTQRIVSDAVDTPAKFANHLAMTDDMIQVGLNNLEKLIKDISGEATAAKMEKQFNKVHKIWRDGIETVETSADRIRKNYDILEGHLRSSVGVLTPAQQLSAESILSGTGRQAILFTDFLKSHYKRVSELWSRIRSEHLTGDDLEHAWNEFHLSESGELARFRDTSAMLGSESYLSKMRFARDVMQMPEPKLNPVQATGRSLTPEDIAQIMGCEVEDMYRGVADMLVMQDKPHFIQLVKRSADAHPELFQGITEEKLSKVYDHILETMSVLPGEDAMIAKFRLSAEAAEKELISLKMARGMTKQQEAALHGYFDEVQSSAKTVFKGEAVKNWNTVRQEAMDAANRTYYRMFANYSNQSIITRFMKLIFPYAAYENYRWWWLGRTALTHPGTVTAWDRYYTESDYGGVNLGVTPFSLNPLAGTVAGPLMGLARRDYPSYYDKLGPAGELMDTLQRLAYFPNPAIMSMAYMSTVLSGKPPELGALLPGYHRFGLNALIASQVPGVTDLAQFLQDSVFHDNFRDYYKAQIVTEKQLLSGGTLAGGVSGADIWEKIQQKVKLEPEEQELWDSAENETAILSMIRSQFSFLRYRPEESNKYFDAIDKIYISYGFTPQQLRDMELHNVRPSDVMGGTPLEVRLALDELWQQKIMRGRSRMLQPSATQDIMTNIDQYWDEVRVRQTQRLSNEQDIENRFFHPESTTKPLDTKSFWDEYRTNWADYTKSVDDLTTYDERFNSADFQLLLTWQGQVDLAKKLGWATPPRSPSDELMDLYFSVEVEDKLNPETDVMEPDYLTFTLKRKAIIDAAPPEYKSDFLNFINKYDTPLITKRDEIMQKYVAGYLAINRIVAATYDAESLALIDEYYSPLATRERKAEIREEIDPRTGNKLISAFESAKTEARRRMRVASPTLDFWLYVFGYIDQPKTATAKLMVDNWEKDRTSILR